MNFKDLLKEELDIFLNPEEFGETFLLDEEEYIGVIEQPNAGSIKEEYEGVRKEMDFILYIKYEERLDKYSSGKQVDLNGRILIVNRVYREENLFVMELEERNRF